MEYESEAITVQLGQFASPARLCIIMFPLDNDLLLLSAGLMFDG